MEKLESISQCSMRYNSEITSFLFATNSEVQTIEKNAFHSLIIKNFSISSKLTELKDGWCKELFLEKITVSPDNPRYSMYKDQFVIGKSSIEQESYDVLIFCPRSIESIDNSTNVEVNVQGKIQIPDFIEIIGPHAFEHCTKIQQVEFSPDSELRIIGEHSFSNTAIERIKIPKKVTQICNESFYNCQQLKEMEIQTNSELKMISDLAFSDTLIESILIPSKVTELKDGCFIGTKIDKITESPNNPRYSMYNDQFFIGKSSIEQENYDVLIRCPRSIEGKILIPDFIEIIKPHAFENCTKIRQVEFSPDSKLRIIGEKSFYRSSITSISIPPKVKIISKSSFSHAHNLENVDFDPDSSLEKICANAFDSTSIVNILLPYSLIEIEEFSFFFSTRKLQEVRF